MAQYLSPEQAAEKLGISVWTIYRKIRCGDIKASKLSRKVIRIDSDNLTEYINNNAI